MEAIVCFFANEERPALTPAFPNPRCAVPFLTLIDSSPCLQCAMWYGSL